MQNFGEIFSELKNLFALPKLRTLILQFIRNNPTNSEALKSSKIYTLSESEPASLSLFGNLCGVIHMIYSRYHSLAFLDFMKPDLAYLWGLAIKLGKMHKKRGPWSLTRASWSTRAGTHSNPTNFCIQFHLPENSSEEADNTNYRRSISCVDSKPSDDSRAIWIGGLEYS